MSLISLHNVRRFIGKTPEQKWLTARFVTTSLLAKLPYVPHLVRLNLAPDEHVDFWWSYFPASFHADRGLFSYWGDDGGELRFLWKFLQPGMTFVDIGAHHGVYSVIAAQKVGKSGQVVAFEPCSRDRRRLSLHLNYNGINSVVVESYALAAKNGKAELFTVLSGYTTMNSLRPPATNHPVEPTTVETTTLDGYLEQRGIDSVDLVKIDTEGAELEVIRGAAQLFHRRRPLVVCEVLDQVTRPWGYSAREIISKLWEYTYTWFDILPDGNIHPHTIQNEYPEPRNYLAVPEETRHYVERFQVGSQSH